MTRFLPHPLLWIVAMSLVALAVVLHGSAQALSPLYYAIMCALGVWGMHGDRGLRGAAVLQTLPLPVLLRAILLGYLAVVVEETLVATLYALNEGFTLGLWLNRVRQFVSFNLLAFTGASGALR